MDSCMDTKYDATRTLHVSLSLSSSAAAACLLLRFSFLEQRAEIVTQHPNESIMRMNQMNNQQSRTGNRFVHGGGYQSRRETPGRLAEIVRSLSLSFSLSCTRISLLLQAHRICQPLLSASVG